MNTSLTDEQIIAIMDKRKKTHDTVTYFLLILALGFFLVHRELDKDTRLYVMGIGLLSYFVSALIFLRCPKCRADLSGKPNICSKCGAFLTKEVLLENLAIPEAEEETTPILGSKPLILKSRRTGQAISALLLFTALTIGAIYQGQLAVGIAFFGMVCIGAYLLLFFGTIEMTSASIIHKTWFGSYSMRWNEIRCIHKFQNVMVLSCPGKQMLLAAPIEWEGSASDKASDYFYYNAEVKNIPIQRDILAFFRFSRNTRL